VVGFGGDGAIDSVIAKALRGLQRLADDDVT
jgi:hypothetical protein